MNYCEKCESVPPSCGYCLATGCPKRPTATHERLDRSKAVNLARNIRETDNIEDITRMGILNLVDGVLRMDAELTRLYRAQSATQPINQCDGCRRGLPLRANNIHYDGEFPSALPVMGCTADRYISSATLPIKVTQAMVDAVNAQDGWSGFTVKDVQGIVDAIHSADSRVTKP